MSASLPNADIERCSGDVRVVPISDSRTAAPAVSFDHLVGSSDQRGRHCEAERLGGLEVDHQFDLVGACTGKSAGFSPLT